MRKSTISYPAKVLEGTPGNQMKKDDLLAEIMSKYDVSQPTAYRYIDKASREGKLAESLKGMVTLVKSEAVEETIPEEIPEEYPDQELEAA